MFAKVDKNSVTEAFSLPVKYSTLSPSERRTVRLQYIKKQNNRCTYCNNYLKDFPPEKILALKVDKGLFPKDFFKYPIHLHHDHDTDLTISAVHAYCNAVLWVWEGI